MGDWQDLLQAIFIGLIFSFLVAKLISTVVSFKDGDLNLVRVGDLDPEPRVSEECRVLEDSRASNNDSDDDWEGVESTELDEIFTAATAFVVATAADRNSSRVSNDVQLELYGLYKIATEGPCSAPQPSALKVSARAKWNAWQSLGAMPPEEAMEKYIAIVSELYPSWLDGSANKNKDDDTADSGRAAKGPMGPVFSSFVYEEESDNDHEGRTPLHWSVDRGHLNVVEMLLNMNADVNAKDNEGQTPLHYAALCERGCCRVAYQAQSRH